MFETPPAKPSGQSLAKALYTTIIWKDRMVVFLPGGGIISGKLEPLFWQGITSVKVEIRD